MREKGGENGSTFIRPTRFKAAAITEYVKTDPSHVRQMKFLVCVPESSCVSRIPGPSPSWISTSRLSLDYDASLLPLDNSSAPGLPCMPCLVRQHRIYDILLLTNAVLLASSRLLKRYRLLRVGFSLTWPTAAVLVTYICPSIMWIYNLALGSALVDCPVHFNKPSVISVPIHECGALPTHSVCSLAWIASLSGHCRRYIHPPPSSEKHPQEGRSLHVS
ncbi:uncharacterized protein [Nerophis lumbriciformis]|uniref:uncharacterized protein isoform X2 n=1 Tax=Nerophis lumbriciformis TaxID=546530 RepID=UPI002ADF25B8|nr:uncharacterized protein LOC133610735 isoform X2 [Nerophis lumbriciformis]